MKKILLLFSALALSAGVQAQVVLNIMSPSSLQGGLTHSNNGAVAGWGLADLLDPADAVLDTVVVMDDSTAGINTVVTDIDDVGCVGYETKEGWYYETPCSGIVMDRGIRNDR